MSTETLSTADDTVITDKLIPIDLDKVPIKYSGNPAELEGALYTRSAATTTRGCPPELNSAWTFDIYRKWLRTTKDLAVVAASQRTSVLHSEDHLLLLAVQDSKLGSAGPPFRILSCVWLRKLSRANESRWVTGVRAGHGQGAGRAGAVEADGEGCPDALERYVRVACVSLSRSVSSHENARVPHTAVPWQALGSLQAVFHLSLIHI